MKKRFAYALLGFALGLILTLGITLLTGKDLGGAAIGVAIGCAAIAVGIAERMGKVKTVDEIHRPPTLFPSNSEDRK